MKKLFLSMTTLLVMSAGLISCSSDDDEQDTNGISVKRTELNDLLKYSTWQEMMDYFKDGAGVNWYGSQGLKIVSYEQLGTVRVNEELLSSMAGCVSPVYDDDNLLVSISSVSELVENKQEQYLSTRKAYLSLYQGENLGEISVKWDYKGQIITTKAYVSTSIVVYDDLMTNVYGVETKSVVKRAPMARRKLRREYVSIPQTYKTDTVKRYIYGQVTAVACASATVGYSENGFRVEQDNYSVHDPGSMSYAGVKYIVDNEYCYLHYIAAVGSISLGVYWDDNHYRISNDDDNDYKTWDIHRGEVSWQTN